ncbi:degenerin unc-8-like [Schistocerca americana]|uniref:degenerin unc-8-like n=1 Tax=Schistocerca americana TaxID=7009 RepID=UPI001F4FB8DF|nr:degenerin unc-8-like [Schistocerca americana]
MDFLAAYLSFSKEQRALMGDSFQQLVVSCQFSGTSCLSESQYFARSVHSGYGNCYTFTTNRKTVLPGKEYGLSLQLSLSREQQLRATLSPEVGARLLIHSPQLAPMPDEAGLNVPPGVATSVALQQVEIIRKALPYTTNCSSTWERTWYASYVGETYNYSLERCRRICLQIAFEEKCQCTHPNYMDLDRGKPPCNLTSDSSDSQCAFTVLEEFEHRLRACSCNVDCREVTYQTSISTAIWPTDSTWCTVAKRFTLVDNCENVTEGNHGAKFHPEKQIIKDNALKIDVYFENLRVQQTVQTAAYEPQAFVASLGGALSLYLGISLLMLVEVVELIIRVISDLYNHFRKQTQMHPKTKGHNLNNAFAHTESARNDNASIGNVLGKKMSSASLPL